MRLSQLLLRTLRDAPADAEAASHQLLVRGGFMRRTASGVYTFLPLGLRVVRNIERVVREEMDAVGAQEMLMPVLQPEELWQQSGRDALLDSEYHAFRVAGRGGTFVLGPTHEEVVTATVSAEVDSHRQLPLTVYQVQVKFRDEARPRFGLLRGREFLMKDAYSFDASKDAMATSYRSMYDAYLRVFGRCGLTAVPVESQAGAIGGDVNHEFMATSAIGEDRFASCAACGYAANTEAAEAGGGADAASPPTEELVEHHTPDCPGIDAVVEHFADRGLTAAGMLKCIALKDATLEITLALVPGDREVRVPPGLVPLDDDDFAARPDLAKGYIGPMGSAARGVRVVADPMVRRPQTWVTGANKPDHHVSGATLGRDFAVDEWASIATVDSGDPCPRCEQGRLELVQSVEVGHCFQLGLRYSQLMPSATFVDASGAEQPFWMGCYGIGISRLVAVVAEAHHDDAGLIWPAEVAPYAVHLIALRNADDAATALYDELRAAGVDVLFDDRDASPGVKFADADLLGVPVQLVVGSKGLARGVVERKHRATGERDDLTLDAAAAALAR